MNGTLDPEPLTLTGTYTFTGKCLFRMAFDVGFTIGVSSSRAYSRASVTAPRSGATMTGR